MTGYWPWLPSFLILVSWDINQLSVQAKPVRGILRCLNNEDCLGANRICFRNTTMTDGVCTCKVGYKPAEGNIIKCLNILKNECDSDLDCPPSSPCTQPLSYISNMELLIDDFNFSFEDMKKRCMFAISTILEPHTGGGLRPGGDFFENLYNLGNHNHRLHTTSSYNGDYIKFVEDAMLVLFLICILVTLLVVHRATCRNFWRARRNGPLRYIIPYREDQPPPYSQYGANNAISAGQVPNGDVPDGDLREDPQGNIVGAGQGKEGQRAETPPPTYDEALLITQALSLSTVAVNPLFIALPASPTAEALPSLPREGDQMAEVSADASPPQVESQFEGLPDEQPPSYVSVSAEANC